MRIKEKLKVHTYYPTLSGNLLDDEGGFQCLRHKEARDCPEPALGATHSPSRILILHRNKCGLCGQFGHIHYSCEGLKWSRLPQRILSIIQLSFKTNVCCSWYT